MCRYVKKHFNEDAKHPMKEMVKDIRAEMEKILNDIDWIIEVENWKLTCPPDKHRNKRHNNCRAMRAPVGCARRAAAR